MEGRFITLEGGEGVGKSTQLARLADALRARGKTVVTTREPGGTQGAEDIRALLMTGEDARWNAQTEALLFAAARADHVAKLIRPAIESGDWVLCDRFVDSTRAYQGGAGGLSDADIMALHGVGGGGLLPDMTLVLDMGLSGSRQRVTKRQERSPDRMGSKAAEYYDRVKAAFLTFAEADPARFRVIDAEGSEAEVTQRLLTATEPLL